MFKLSSLKATLKKTTCPIVSLLLACTMVFNIPSALSEPYFYDAPVPKYKSIDVIVGLSKPPYVIEETDSGYEIELITAVLNDINLQPKFIYVPLGRTLRLLDQGMGAMLLTINKNIVPNNKIRTRAYVTYQNVAVYRQDSNFHISSVEQLKKLRVAAFQNATKYLGHEFETAIKFNKSYFEVPSQFQQVRLLLEGRIDVAIMDINIFSHILAQVSDTQSQDVQFETAPIFARSDYSAAFKDSNLVKPFNQALVTFRSTSAYQDLKDKYRIKNQ